jgi:hypothetical protein
MKKEILEFSKSLQDWKAERPSPKGPAQTVLGSVLQGVSFYSLLLSFKVQLKCCSSHSKPTEGTIHTGQMEWIL